MDCFGMNSKRKEYFIPIFTTVLGVALGYALTLIPKVEKPAELVLENFFISPNDQNSAEYGLWELKKLKKVDLWEPLQEFQGMDLGAQEDASITIHMKAPYIENEDRVIVHEIFWEMDSASLNWLFSNGDELRWNSKRIPKNIKSKMILDPKITKYRSFNNETSNFEWRMSALSFISNMIEAPKLKFIFRNVGESSASVYGIRVKNLYSTGGEAGAGGKALEIANNEQIINLNYQIPVSDLIFNSPVVIDPKDTAMFQVLPIISDAIEGDGEGELTFNIFVIYRDGEKRVEQYVGTFVQSDRISQMGLF